MTSLKSNYAFQFSPKIQARNFVAAKQLQNFAFIAALTCSTLVYQNTNNNNFQKTQQQDSRATTDRRGS